MKKCICEKVRHSVFGAADFYFLYFCQLILKYGLLCDIIIIIIRTISQFRMVKLIWALYYIILRYWRKKPYCIATELVDKMESKGITFQTISKSDAAKYLTEKNNFLRLYAYRKNFQISPFKYFWEFHMHNCHWDFFPRIFHFPTSLTSDLSVCFDVIYIIATGNTSVGAEECQSYICVFSLSDFIHVLHIAK